MADKTATTEPAKNADLAQAGADKTVSTEKTPVFSGEVVFNDSIVIYAGNRLPQYDKGAVKAYAAHGTGSVPGNLFAMLCEDHLSPRIMKTSNYAAIITASLARLVACGPVEWPASGKERYCFIFENNLGVPLLVDDVRGGMGLKPDLVLNNIIRPLVNILTDLRDKDIVHGNIRLSNIYDANSTGFEKIMLGECLSTPASYNQPVIYEPIDRAMADPLGRGVGSLQDDLYSLGVCLGIMMRYVDPMERLSDEEIIEQKIEEGSYACIVGKDRFSGAMLELLRGLLYDDPAQRWTLDEVHAWLDGRRLSPKQSVRRLRANRPISFNGGKYIRPELLARDLVKNTAEARQLVEDGELEQWLARALEDKPSFFRYEKALKDAEESGKVSGYNDRLVARLSIALHPEAPIRYKAIIAMPEGVGVALTESYILKRDVQSYVDFFMAYFITQWIDAQPNTVPDVSNLISKFDGARAFLRQKGMGGGIERCLYSLNPEIHCLSEKLQKYIVRTPEDLMHAYEKMAKSPNRPAMFFDRHIVAFLSVKDRKNIDPYIHDINASEGYRRVLAEVKALATIQKRSQMERFPGIASWVVEALEPVYDRFHDRELRNDIRRKAERLKDNGDLAKIVILFDNQDVYNEDNNAFRKAMREYHGLENEMVEIEHSLRHERSFGQDVGRRRAAVISGILATLTIIITLLSNVSTVSTRFF